jgi:hypothetical protein
MIDLVVLGHALTWWAENDPEEYDPYIESAFDAARSYADLLENGRQVQWCGKHDCDAVPRLGRDPFTCWKAEFTRHLDPKDCRIVSKLLIEVPE